MNWTLTFAYTLSLMLGVSPIVHSQWTQTHGPEGGSVRCILADSTVVFAGTERGLYCSRDAGASWTIVYNGPGSAFIGYMVFDHSRLFVEADGRIFCSTDKGETWRDIHSRTVGFLAADDSLLIVTTSYAIEISSDLGARWTSSSTWMGDYNFTGLAVKKDNIFAGTSKGLLRSTDRGQSWFQDSLIHGGVIRITNWKNLLYVSTDSSLYWTADSGRNWNRTNIPWAYSGFAPAIVVQHPSGQTRIYFQADSFYVSTDTGRTWQSLSAGSWTYDLAAGVDLTGHLQLYRACDSGIFLSDDGGVTWRRSNTGLYNTYVEDLAAAGTRLFAAVRGSALRVSPNRGSTWNVPDAGEPIGANVVYTSGSHVIAGTYTDCFHSSDSGAHWSRVGPPGHGAYAFTGHDGVTFVGTMYGVWSSRDTGATWTYVGSPSQTVETLAWSGNTLLASSWYVGLLSSTDQGVHWTSGNAAFKKGGISCLVVHDSYVYAGTYEGVYRSADDGVTWAFLGPKDHRITSLAFAGPAIFAGDYDDGVFVSTDNGDTWTASNANLSPASVLSLLIADSMLYAGTRSAGVWQRPLADILKGGKNGDSPRIPRQFFLHQNYPNPFNSTTIIRFGIAAPSHATLIIFNTLGQKVAELVSGEIDAGYHEVQFDASHLASGVYFCRLQAASAVDTKKLLLLK